MYELSFFFTCRLRFTELCVYHITVERILKTARLELPSLLNRPYKFHKNVTF
jgi:hypothetical protein